MILACRNCGHVWNYTGKKAGVESGTSCPNCFAYVNFNNSHVDTTLQGDMYDGAIYLGVTEYNTPVWWDPAYEVAVNWLVKPDEFTEEKCHREDLIQYMKDVGFQLGWRYRISTAELISIISTSTDKTLTPLSKADIQHLNDGYVLEKSLPVSYKDIQNTVEFDQLMHLAGIDWDQTLENFPNLEGTNLIVSDCGEDSHGYYIHLSIEGAD